MFIGGSSAIFAVGTILLFGTLFDFNNLYCLFGLGLLPLSFIISYPILMKDDKAVAKLIDSTFELNEKTQTMVEFINQNEDLYPIQREHTESILGSCDIKRIKFNLWIYILILIMSLGVLTCGIVFLFKASSVEPIIDDKPIVWQGSDWEWQALDELIEYVEYSSADVKIMKPKTLSSLNALRTILKGEVTPEQLPLFVGVTQSEINVALEEANAQIALSEGQKTINSELRDYVNNRLYEIFGLKSPSEDNVQNDNPDDVEHEGGGGSGEISMGADEKFFHPVLGYVRYKDIIGEYYETLNKAFQEGVISQEQWYDYMMMYFRYLYGTEE